MLKSILLLKRHVLTWIIFCQSYPWQPQSGTPLVTLTTPTSPIMLRYAYLLGIESGGNTTSSQTFNNQLVCSGCEHLHHNTSSPSTRPVGIRTDHLTTRRGCSCSANYIFIFFIKKIKDFKRVNILIYEWNWINGAFIRPWHFHALDHELI